LIFNYINPIFDGHFIKDSYSCRKGKGTSKGIKRVSYFIRSCSENYQKDTWILKLDIQGYFMAMDRNIIFKKIEEKLRNVRNTNFNVDLILYLIFEVIFNDPTTHCHMKGSNKDWDGLPKSKSLFFSQKGRGFPIGNLTSQLFGNIYLDELDHFVHEKIGVKHYGRYVDDMVFVHNDKDFLKDVVIKIKDYLHNELGLTLHPKKIYLQNYRRGVYFLGVFIKPHCIYIGRKTKQNFNAKLISWNRDIETKKDLSRVEKNSFISCVNSYLGIMKHYNTYYLRKKITDKNVSILWWRHLFLSWDISKVVLREKK
ncbi:MAG: RNA-directed DNA polymerase, partial [bacterium]